MCSNNTNIFFINMKKNVGKRTLIDNIVKKLNAMLWNGVDKSIYDQNGILLNSFGHDERTRAAKEAKINLFEYFLKNCSHDYLVLFEDDIILHKKFYDYFDILIDFANKKDFKLIYMGVSCNVSSEQYKLDKLEIKPLPKTGYRLSGAYGVIIHRSIMPSLINRSNDPLLYNRPFDIYSLGHVQLCQPNNCYICYPQLVIPDITISDIRNPRSQDAFWRICHIDKDQYVQHETLPLYVLADTNEDKIKQFIGILSIFIPFVRPIFICKNGENIIPKLCDNAYETICIDQFSDNNIKKIITFDKYALTNIYVNWTKNINNIFDVKTNIKYEISNCPRCSILSSYCHSENIDPFILNDMTIITDNTTKINISHNNNLFYTTGCMSDKTGNMHLIYTK